ncbi:Dihydrolipoyllysine-residue acetyltransferase component of acetoin cleaving system [Nocardia otitidiscaviarum]|uniref:Dihydrolipoyllysine-residue acetyltransferase component of acetoin cleaving system n=2 Tax=Nocardia otitidiscaviarum TaxID=1823 RepID=A0A378YAV8_9NOCA|nr:Dihydrolipoyllysine-residue acetyltransferase component of acetoin cleaving system [Nocardia otitidiscaviarum]
MRRTRGIVALMVVHGSVDAIPVPEPRLRTGRGAPVLLLHGFLLTWQSWGAVIDDLAGDHDVFAPTLPGHFGGPPARQPATIPGLVDHVEAMLDEVGWRTAHLVGNSLGGWIACELAARGRATTLTAIAPAGFWPDRPTAETLIRKFRSFGPLVGLNTADGLPVMPNMLRSLLIPLLAHQPAVVPNRLANAMAATPAHCTIIKDLAEDPAIPAGFTKLPELDLPITILRPEHDRIIPPHFYAPDAFTGHPTLTDRPLPGVGHVPMLEAPTLIASEIRKSIGRA